MVARSCLASAAAFAGTLLVLGTGRFSTDDSGERSVTEGDAGRNLFAEMGCWTPVNELALFLANCGAEFVRIGWASGCASGWASGCGISAISGTNPSGNAATSEIRKIFDLKSMNL
jgi:hypothetical protein